MKTKKSNNNEELTINAALLNVITPMGLELKRNGLVIDLDFIPMQQPKYKPV